MDPAEARELIETTAIETNFVGLSKDGNMVYQRLLDTGAQIWVYVREGTIRDAGATTCHGQLHSSSEVMLPLDDSGSRAGVPGRGRIPG